MKKIKDSYQKYRWFFTSRNKLVVGGKNSGQNEELVKEVSKADEKLIMMHTNKPGSPFTVTLANYDSLYGEDLREMAIFSACFSQQWKKNKKKVKVDIFNNHQISKGKNMKEGTFRVSDKEEKMRVGLILYLKKQKNRLRAVPFKTGDIYITPGKMTKEKASELISKKLNIEKDEVMQALPAGGFNIHLEKNE